MNTYRCVFGQALARRAISAAVCLAIASSPLASFAQEVSQPAAGSPEAVASARSHFARGVKLYEEDDFRAALIEFTRAYELAPNWAVLYNVGQSYYQLRDYANALRTLEQYVNEGGAKIAADRRAQVDREIEEVRGRVAHVTLTVNVPDADITLDDTPLGKSPLREAVLVGAGRHKLSAIKPGFVLTSKVIDIAGTDNVTVTLDLQAEPTRAQAGPVGPPPNYVPAAVVAGVGVAGLAVGTIFGVATISNKNSLNTECNAQKACPASAQGDIDAFSRNGIISTIGFGVGVAGLGVGTYLFVRERNKGSESAMTPSAERNRGPTVSPWIGLGSAGLTGSF